MAPTTLQQERRELWNTVLDEVGQQHPDPARAAACTYLLDHLIRSATPPERRQSGGYRFTGTTSSKMCWGN
jgi:hypothetical protein